MNRIKIFISSVQSEFTFERMELYKYILSDAMLGRFFMPFLFELLPTTYLIVSRVYLHQVEKSSICISLFGRQYGFEDLEGVSPSEQEFNHAIVYFLS